MFTILFYIIPLWKILIDGKLRYGNNKSKVKKERYTHLDAEFQRIARRDKKAFFSDQCK